MTRTVSPSSITPGTVVAFAYNGGSNPGTLRVVTVKEAPAGHIKGNDLMATPDEGGSIYRDFLTHKIVNDIHLVADRNEEIIPLGTLVAPGVKVDANTALALFQLNHPNRKNVRYYPPAQVIVARRDNVPRVEFEITADKIHFNVVNEDGKNLGLFWEHSTFPPTNGPVECRIDAKTLAEFASQLLFHVTQEPKVPTSRETAEQTPQAWSDFVTQQAKSGHPFYAGTGSNG